MSKRGYISRYLLILKKLKAKPYCTYEELRDYMEGRIEYLQEQDNTLNIGFSKRTLQRDIREIRNTWGIEIEYSKAGKGYLISSTRAEDMNFQRMMESFDVFNSLNLAQDAAPFIHLEKRRPQGTDNMYGLLHAIKNKWQLRFAYQKFWEDEGNMRLAEPYALKEFRNRWYIIARDTHDGHIKSFALDRLKGLEITNRHFEAPKDYDIEDSYRYYFGIINPQDEKPEDIVLVFDWQQGKYIKTLPLHHTQEVLIDNDEELHVSLKLCVTHDFVMELLSFGESLKVMQPQSLVDLIREEHRKAWERYA